MSTYAKNSRGEITRAKEALRMIDYFCLECESPVRLRMGEERRAHFYHLEPTIDCRESGKSLEHLMSQVYIQKAFQERNEELLLEKRFPSINRIGDAVALNKRIVFEIQCSPMTVEEAKGRMRDYERIGYSVVWILHTKTFLKNRATAFEKYLTSKPHYFTDIDEDGVGEIFDLFAPICKGYRARPSHRFKVDIVNFTTNAQKSLFRKDWELHFSGDILFHLKEKSLDDATRERLFYSLFAEKEQKETLTLFQKSVCYLRLFFNEWLRSYT